jgi:YD repeat-containing protein
VRDNTRAGTTYSYDPNGNVLSKVEGADTWTYEWSSDNLLKRVTRNGAEVAHFAYDPAGRRVTEVAGGVTTSYTYADQDIVREVRGGTTLTYVPGRRIDEPLAVEAAATATYFRQDALGSVVKTTNASGAVVSSRQYDARGGLQAGADEPGYSYTAEGDVDSAV